MKLSGEVSLAHELQVQKGAIRKFVSLPISSEFLHPLQFLEIHNSSLLPQVRNVFSINLLTSLINYLLS